MRVARRVPAASQVLILLFNYELEDNFDEVAPGESYVETISMVLPPSSTAVSLLVPILMLLFIIFHGVLLVPSLSEPSVQQLRNHAADVARSRDEKWLQNVLQMTATPPPMHRFASSVFVRPEIVKSAGIDSQSSAI